MRKTIGMNRHQKAACKPGEARVNAAEIAQLLAMSRSDDPRDRRTAASLLCPCHVRRRIGEVCRALYRMMEDTDARVRRAAWHTLEDGGGGDSPEVQAISARVLASETDQGVRNLIEQSCGSAHDRLERQRIADRASAAPILRRRGKCDFCGERQAMVADDVNVPIPDGGDTRAAQMCASCEKRYA